MGGYEPVNQTGSGTAQGWWRYFYFTPVCPLAPMS
jgi:hypothetical protein